MKNTSKLLEEVSRLLDGKGWKLCDVSKSVYNHVNDSVLGVRQTIAIWSMRDGGSKKSDSEVVQVEILVRINSLEDFIASNLGVLYVNEMGKTVSVFLHRIIPNGRNFTQGFPLGIEPSGDSLSCLGLVEIIDAYGFSFAQRAATGVDFLSDSSVDPRLVDPLKWEVRKVLFSLVKTNTEPAILLRKSSTRLESDLRKKFDLISKFSRAVDVEEEIRVRIEKFNKFSKLIEDKDFVEKARSEIHVF